MAKRPGKTRFEEYLVGCNDQTRDRLSSFFVGVREHCLIDKKTKKQIISDFENTVLYYINSGVSLDDALKRLDVKHLGGFYARPAVAWFPLDDAAKIYPVSMGRNKMAIFRLSVYLKGEIVPELLQMALNFTIKRFPTFATTLKKGFFWHYLDTAKRRFAVEREDDIPCRPMAVGGSGSQSFRVLYHKNRISVEFFHVLTDGTGGTEFLKALVCEYLRLCGVEIPDGTQHLNIHENPPVLEFENAFLSVPKCDNATGFVNKPALQLSGKLSEVKPCRVLHFNMSATRLKAAAKRHGVTVTAFMLGLMFISAKAACDELKGEISFQVPVNMRKFYPSKTLRNFSMYCGIRLPIGEITTLSEILPEITRQLEQKAAKDKMSEMLTATQNLVGMLTFVPLFIKQPVAKLIYGFLGDQIFTSTLSNLGVVSLPEAAESQIESMDFVLGTSVVNRASCSMVTVGDTVTFSVAKITVDPSFEEKLYDLLSQESVEASVKGSELYGN